MNRILSFVLAVSVAGLQLVAPSQVRGGESLESSFQNPPDSAKPHTWWHWMNGNVTREGITADLEAMTTAGLGGAQMFHVGEKIPAGPFGYMSQQWREMVVHATKEAERLGLELCIHNCPGWSSSAGPWITPEYAMQVIAWSDKQVHGPAHFSEALPQPKAPQVLAAVNFYRDIAVLAFPAGNEKPLGGKKLLGKTGVTRVNLPDPEADTTGTSSGIAADKIVVLTEKMDTSGTLTWDVPPGNWIVVRIGYTPTGAKNRAAPPEGLGLEVDKLSREALDVHWNGMMAKVIADLGPLAGKVLNNALIDSYEVGDQNWTPKFREEFQKRRGYDLLKWLPAITGRTVGSPAETERFLWDFRRTIADLYADNYYGYFGELCHQHGMKFSTEPYGNGGFDNLQCGGLADIPMGEFWIGGHYMRSGKLASSAAHTNARKFVGAESFTASLAAGKYQLDPYGVKVLGDEAFCQGINRYVFHRYAHQPWLDVVPGMTMGKWGMHLERTITWWNEAAAWFKYIARAQYLLQEGHFVADALYYQGEGAPNDLPERKDLKPALPEGYDYDGCDVTTLLNRVSVKDHKLVLPDDMSYRVLVLPDSKYMTPRVAEKIQKLVAAGATVVGPKPQQSPSLNGYPQCDERVRAIAQEVWGDADGSAVKERTYREGRVIVGMPLTELFQMMRLAPDFEYQRKGMHAQLDYIHRRAGEADVYFVSNQLYRVSVADCTFRVRGRAPELWHPETGQMEPARVYREQDGRTVVPLTLQPAESVFVVFRGSANAKHLTELVLAGDGASTSSTEPRVVVHKASYETTDGAKSLNVTRLVRKMVEQGTYEIPATTEIMGEPLKGAVKQLRVDYEVDGKAKSAVVGERGMLQLSDIVYAPGLPAYEVHSGTDQHLLLTPWQAGTYQYQSAEMATKTLEVKQSAQSVAVAGPWMVKFQRDRDAPPSIELPQLISWTEHTDPGVKYFSGTAEYETDFEVPAEFVGKSRATVLDLGRVKNFATVELNGKELGVLWKVPFRADVQGALKPGKNHLKVKVTNLWPNRLIGDEQLPQDVEWKEDSLKAWPNWLLEHKARPSGRIAFSTWKFFDKDSPLLESGLLGPVTVTSVERISLN